MDRLVEFSIEHLYGLYNHNISFDSSESVAILHGPNGVGKTAILKCINYLLSCNFSELRKLPYSKINATLSNGVHFKLIRVGVGTNDLLMRAVDPSQKLSVEVFYKGQLQLDYTFVGEPDNVGSDIPPWYRRMSDTHYMDETSGEIYSSEYLFKKFSKASVKPKDRKNLATIKAMLGVVKVHLVEANRLYTAVEGTWPKPKSSRMRFSVQECSDFIVGLISVAQNNYGKTAQVLDQSFPHRFISDIDRPMEVYEIKERLKIISGKLAVLMKIGLLDAENFKYFDPESLDGVDQNKARIMDLYVRDSEEKLAVFDDLALKIKLLLNSLNKKFKNKEVFLNKDSGLAVRGPKGLELPLESLSSGEQHEMVLLSELLFKVPYGTLVLIDEPELSLHVKWQREFLPELISIAHQVGFVAIIATHSPFIVGERFDLMVSLDPGADE